MDKYCHGAYSVNGGAKNLLPTRAQLLCQWQGRVTFGPVITPEVQFGGLTVFAPPLFMGSGGSWKADGPTGAPLAIQLVRRFLLERYPGLAAPQGLPGQVSLVGAVP